MKTIPRIIQRRLFLFCLPGLLISIGCQRDRDGRVYVTEHYYGWVRIEYGVAGAPRLSEVSFIEREPPFRESGLLQTSSELRQDSVNVQIYFGTAMEVRPVPDDMIHGRVSSQSVVRPDGSRFGKQFETFFLGPKDLYEKHKRELARFRKANDKYVIPSLEDLPKVGNIQRFYGDD